MSQIKIRYLSKDKMDAILNGLSPRSSSKTDVKIHLLSTFSITFKVQLLIFKESALLQKRIIIDAYQEHLSVETKVKAKKHKIFS